MYWKSIILKPYNYRISIIHLFKSNRESQCQIIAYKLFSSMVVYQKSTHSQNVIPLKYEIKSHRNRNFQNFSLLPPMKPSVSVYRRTYWKQAFGSFLARFQLQLLLLLQSHHSLERSQHQAEIILKYNVVSVQFFSNASPISFPPSYPIPSSPIELLSKEKYAEAQYGQCIVLLQCYPNIFCSFISNIIVVYRKQQSQWKHTEIQLVQCFIFQQTSRNFFYSSISNIIFVYKWLVNKY
eukprot:TRINITY_DN1127_c0_g3_i1.p1 TRINITY_DN1127_c0_g3~~TRINITY_DN1127_c0_g3_i1.p1  ORF type:complete len:271 (-),score=-46.13 TRINITY_DN1127_c0_g3_i1:140-853(-)